MNDDLQRKLEISIYNGDIGKIKEAFNDGVDVNINNSVLLQLAILNGHLDIVKYLVKMGADIHVNNDEPLTFATVNGHTEIEQFLKLCMRDDKMSKNLVKIMLKDV